MNLGLQWIGRVSNWCHSTKPATFTAIQPSIHDGIPNGKNYFSDHCVWVMVSPSFFRASALAVWLTRKDLIGGFCVIQLIPCLCRVAALVLLVGPAAPWTPTSSRAGVVAAAAVLPPPPPPLSTLPPPPLHTVSFCEFLSDFVGILNMEFLLLLRYN